MGAPGTESVLAPCNCACLAHVCVTRPCPSRCMQAFTPVDLPPASSIAVDDSCCDARHAASAGRPAEPFATCAASGVVGGSRKGSALGLRWTTCDGSMEHPNVPAVAPAASPWAAALAARRAAAVGAATVVASKEHSACCGPAAVPHSVEAEGLLVQELSSREADLQGLPHDVIK
jgi:hypothetical protein